MATSAESSHRPETPSAVKPKPKKNLNFCGEPSFVTFIVGLEAQKFTVHKNLAEHYSPFFEKAFNSGFIEGKTQQMVLEDVEPEIFGYMVNWLYTQKIIHPEDKGIEPVEFAKLWVLAGRFMIPQLQNEAIQRIKPTTTLSLGNFQPCMTFVLNKQFEGTQLYQAVLDDVLQLCLNIAGITTHFGPPRVSDLKDFVETVMNEGGDTTAAIIKALILQCAPYRSNSGKVKKPIKDYFVEEGDVASGQ
ncbi:hypothetical protein LOCC1_G003653 [Lachnellula occidentalis]|uniref:BTB domain-containing protein n=1 Tax=Lachnellula occidentalis TaxID=215460 RepID=A0A8H8UGT5_9HELO|nr:hypothetical protein LOCC1_G003653 [Lachnellula occidentalis]